MHIVSIGALSSLFWFICLNLGLPPGALIYPVSLLDVLEVGWVWPMSLFSDKLGVLTKRKTASIMQVIRTGLSKWLSGLQQECLPYSGFVPAFLVVPLSGWSGQAIAIGDTFYLVLYTYG
jgi:hypothetical protein